MSIPLRHLSPRGLALCIAAVSLTLATSCGGNDGRSRGHALPDEILAVMSKPIYEKSSWGLRVVDVQSGELIYDVNPDRNFLIGSVRKAFSVGLALDALGPDYRFQTTVHRRGTVDAAGVLDGDLILVASGDLSMGGRTNPDGSFAITDLDHNEANALGDAELTAPDPLAGYRALATQIAAAGIRQVRGDVIVDERLWEPFDFRGEFNVSPIFVNDNVVDVAITPGATGSPARVVSRPRSAAFEVQSTLATGAAGSDVDVDLEPVLPRCVGSAPCAGAVSGSVPSDLVGPIRGRLPLVRTFRITDPAAYARTVLIEALEAAGVVVDAPAVAPNAAAALPPQASYPVETRVAELRSATYGDHAKHILKVSYNIGADTSLMYFGLTRGVRRVADALAVERQKLATDFGLDTSEMEFVDGSGGGLTRASNQAVTDLFQAMTRRPVYSDFREALPRLGLDGSLATITGFMSDPTLAGARGQVQAKTGTLAEGTEGGILIRGEAFGGYIRSRGGRDLAYQLVVNEVGPFADFGQILSVIDDLGVVSALIWREN